LQSETWLHNKAEELSGGFGWRGGNDPDTQGIWIWNEPFFFTTADAEKVKLKK